MPDNLIEDEPFAYEHLIAHIRELIRGGTLRPGDRLPSVRRMSAPRGISIPTVLHAYRVLEAGRIIAARPRSGFYVRPTQAVALPGRDGIAGLAEAGEITTADLITRCAEMVSSPALIPLGAALPDPDL